MAYCIQYNSSSHFSNSDLRRVLRPALEKEHAVILDHTENWKIHGLPTRPRIWALDGVETPEKKRFQQTRNADGLIEEFEITESDSALEAVEDDLVEPVSFAILADLLEIQRARGYRRGWVYYQLRKLKPPLPVWQEYGRLRGYKPGWAWHKYQEQQQAEEVRA